MITSAQRVSPGKPRGRQNTPPPTRAPGASAATGGAGELRVSVTRGGCVRPLRVGPSPPGVCACTCSSSAAVCAPLRTPSQRAHARVCTCVTCQLPFEFVLLSQRGGVDTSLPLLVCARSALPLWVRVCPSLLSGHLSVSCRGVYACLSQAPGASVGVQLLLRMRVSLPSHPGVSVTLPPPACVRVSPFHPLKVSDPPLPGLSTDPPFWVSLSPIFHLLDACHCITSLPPAHPVGARISPCCASVPSLGRSWCALSSLRLSRSTNNNL